MTLYSSQSPKLFAQKLWRNWVKSMQPIDALPHLLEVPGGIHPGELRYSPYWDPLRKDPRFEALAEESTAGSLLADEQVAAAWPQPLRWFETAPS